MTRKIQVDLSRDEGLRQGAHRASGVVLRRKEGSVRSQELLLFLRTSGATWVGAPGATSAKNRFGGGIEPMVWGEYDLYQSPRRLYLKGVDVKEDFLQIRTSRRRLETAVKWCGELARRLPLGMENDALLSLLWGSMKNLRAGGDPALLDLRFAWRWANLWGLAPPLDVCSSCGRALPDRDAPDGGEAALSRDGVVCAPCRAAANVSGIAIGNEELASLACAATLPVDAFMAWQREPGAPLRNARGIAAWLYSFVFV